MNDVKPVEGIYQGNVKVRLNTVKKIPRNPPLIKGKLMFTPFINGGLIFPPFEKGG